MKIRNVELATLPAMKTPRVWIAPGILAVVVLCAGSLMAQEATTPEFDGSLLDACLENASLRAEDGGEKDAESCINVAAKACMETEGGYSTAGMNYCVGEELKVWDSYLNSAYSELIATVKEADESYSDKSAPPPNRVDLLKNMQNSWIAFRDATCSFEQAEFYGGTMASNILIGCLHDLTAKQALALEEYRDSYNEK